MDKKNRKLLTYIKKHPNCIIPKESTDYETAIYLSHNKYVVFKEGNSKNGLPSGTVYYSITNLGLDALSATQWFNL